MSAPCNHYNECTFCVFVVIKRNLTTLLSLNIKYISLWDIKYLNF